MKATWIVIILGLTVCTSIFAAEDSDQAINILSAQQVVNEKAISDLQSNVKIQLAQIQTEIQQIQAQLASASKPGSVPVVTATPGPAQ